MAVQFTKLSVSPEVVQTTGTSETAVMSQKAVTDALASAGGGSSGGVVLKTITLNSSNIYYNAKNLLNKGITNIILQTSSTQDKQSISCTTNTTNLTTGEHSKSTSSNYFFVANQTNLFRLSAYNDSRITFTTHGWRGLFLDFTITSGGGPINMCYRSHSISSGNEIHTYGTANATSISDVTFKLCYYDTE